MESMTSRERLAAALLGRRVDRLPFAPFLAYVWESFPADVQARGQLQFHHDIGADPLWRGAPCPVRVSTPGLEVRTRQEGRRAYAEFETPVGTLRTVHITSPDAGQTAFIVEHPVKTVEDLKTQLWIEEHTRIEFDPKPAEDHLTGAGRDGLSLGMLVYRGKTAFQAMVEYTCGTEELVMLLADAPDETEALAAAMTANNLRCAELAAQAPYDFWLTFEDSSTQNYSPRLYERFIEPEIARYCEMLGGMGKRYVQHACGHLRHLLPAMTRSGVVAVESLSPPPTGNITLREARAILGADVGIIGGIEPTAFLNLPDDEFPAYVEQVIRDGSGGPFILANSDSCPPGVTPERFAVAARVARNAAAG
jgi:hypothetical protein